MLLSFRCSTTLSQHTIGAALHRLAEKQSSHPGAETRTRRKRNHGGMKNLPLLEEGSRVGADRQRVKKGHFPQLPWPALFFLFLALFAILYQ